VAQWLLEVLSGDPHLEYGPMARHCPGASASLWCKRGTGASPFGPTVAI